MKYLLTLLLCFFASNAFASTADSGRCPWKIPFTLIIHGQQRGDIQEPDSLNLAVTVREDSSITEPDTLQSHSGSDGADTSLLILFMPGKDSILSLTLTLDSYSSDVFGNMTQTQQQHTAFQIFSLAFNDSAIFTIDSSFCGHSISMTSSGYINFGSGNIYNNFIATSAELSGLFEPKDYTCTESVVNPLSSSELIVQNPNGSIACSFDVSDHARDLEIFSPLGIREASYTIQTGQTEASLPHLPAGFYFVRLEGAMAKICVTE